MKSDLTDDERILLMQGKPREQWASLIADRDRSTGKPAGQQPDLFAQQPAAASGLSEAEKDAIAAVGARFAAEDARVERERANQRARHAAASPPSPQLRLVNKSDRAKR